MNLIENSMEESMCECPDESTVGKIKKEISDRVERITQIQRVSQLTAAHRLIENPNRIDPIIMMPHFGLPKKY